MRRQPGDLYHQCLRPLQRSGFFAAGEGGKALLQLVEFSLTALEAIAVQTVPGHLDQLISILRRGRQKQLRDPGAGGYFHLFLAKAGGGRAFTQAQIQVAQQGIAEVILCGDVRGSCAEP